MRPPLWTESPLECPVLGPSPCARSQGPGQGPRVSTVPVIHQGPAYMPADQSLLSVQRTVCSHGTAGPGEAP